MLSDTLTMDPVTFDLVDNRLTVRDLVNLLLDVPSGEYLVLSYDQGYNHSEGTFTPKYHLFLREAKDGKKGDWINGRTLAVYNASRPLGATYRLETPREDYKTSLWGFITVRELINRLLGVNPDLTIVAGSGSVSGLVALRTAHVNPSSGDIGIHSNPIWET